MESTTRDEAIAEFEAMARQLFEGFGVSVEEAQAAVERAANDVYVTPSE